jgi:hypothetical protein
LTPSAGRQSTEATLTTVSYVVHPGLGGGERRSMHKNFHTPLRKTITQTIDLLTWPEGWNGHDAAAPDRASVEHALAWIRNIYEDTLTANGAWIPPHVIADAHGNVVFEWWEGYKKLTVYVSPDTVEYVKVWGPDMFSDMEDGELARAEDHRTLWRWLTE